MKTIEGLKRPVTKEDNCFVRLAMCLAVVLVSLTLLSCSTSKIESPAPQAGRVMKDGLGRDVRLPIKVERAVSLAPSLTEMVFAAGAGSSLVGVTTYCDFPGEAKEIAKVGDTQTPNIERIVALRPQLVLVSTASQLQAFTEVLDKQGIGVYVLDVKGISDVSSGLRTLGEIFGTEQSAEAAIQRFETRVAAVDVAAAKTKKVPVFVQISRDPLFTIGSDSFLTELVSRAGGESVTKGVATAYPALSKEAALAMDPKVIILSDSEDNREPSTVFANSPAVRNGRVYRINADIISRPGPRLVDALEQLAEILKKEAGTASVPK